MLPEFDQAADAKQSSVDDIVLDPSVVTELRDYVTAVSQLYYHNPFHNFEHASHVVMSVSAGDRAHCDFSRTTQQC